MCRIGIMEVNTRRVVHFVWYHSTETNVLTEGDSPVEWHGWETCLFVSWLKKLTSDDVTTALPIKQHHNLPITRTTFCRTLRHSQTTYCRDWTLATAPLISETIVVFLSSPNSSRVSYMINKPFNSVRNEAISSAMAVYISAWLTVIEFVVSPIKPPGVTSSSQSSPYS